MPDGVRPHLQEFYALLDQFGYRAHTIGNDVVPMTCPFDEVRSVMSRCDCTIVLGIHQLVASDVTLKGIKQGRLILPTEWNHIEATASLMIGLPTLVLLHENVAARGIFERGAANIFVHEFRAQEPGWSMNVLPALAALKRNVEKARSLRHGKRGQSALSSTSVAEQD